jgi:hypothetical protein
VEAEAALLDLLVGPDSGHEFAFADDFASATDQKAENIKRTTAKRRGCAVAFQESSTGNNAEWSKRKCF